MPGTRAVRRLASADARTASLQRLYGPVMLGAAAVIVLTQLVIFGAALGSHDFPVFDDLRIYQDATRRLLSGGVWYVPHQLEGPYTITHGDVLYPPVLAWFILPWLVLPAWTFVAIPFAALAAFVRWCRPAPWAWPLIALGATFNVTLLYVVFANPSLWIAVFLAAGLRWAWPAVFVLLKPSLAPLALVGVRDRRWWVGLLLLGLGSLPFAAATLAYPRVILDSDANLLYSGTSFGIALVPIAAWLGRRP